MNNLIIQSICQSVTLIKYIFWIKDLKVRLETIKLLEGNGSGKCLKVSLGYDSLDLIPKTKATEAETSKSGYIKLKTFCRVKKANKMKRQPSEWGKKLLADHVSDELML